jgi:hypothetical protein
MRTSGHQQDRASAAHSGAVAQLQAPPLLRRMTRLATPRKLPLRNRRVTEPRRSLPSDRCQCKPSRPPSALTRRSGSNSMGM